MSYIFIYIILIVIYITIGSRECAMLWTYVEEGCAIVVNYCPSNRVATCASVFPPSLRFWRQCASKRFPFGLNICWTVPRCVMVVPTGGGLFNGDVPFV